MANSDTEQRPARPPFGEMLQLSFQRLFQGVVRLPFLFALAVGGVVALSLCSLEFGPAHWGGATAASRTPAYYDIAWAAVVSAGRLAFLAPLSIAMYRFVLRDETNAWRAIASNTAIFLAWWVLLDLLPSIADALRALWSPRSTGIFSPIALVAIPLMVLLSVRLWLIFPAIALGTRAPFLERARISWRQTRGHFWYLFWLAAVTGLPFRWPFSFLSSLMGWSTASDAAGHPQTAAGLSFYVIGAVVASMGTTLNTAASAAVGAGFYRAVVLGGLSDVEQTAAHFT
jgi:hypothetical protein